MMRFRVTWPVILAFLITLLLGTVVFQQRDSIDYSPVSSKLSKIGNIAGLNLEYPFVSSDSYSLPPGVNVFPSPQVKPDNEEYLAICMAVSNQAADLQELLVHHYHHLGIRRFYIMDDGSEPPLSTYSYSIPKEAITFYYTKSKPKQVRLYNKCNELYGKNHEWLGFFDADEFLEMTGEMGIVDMLKEFATNETVGALGVQWITHKSNGVLLRPESNRKAFTSCMADDPELDNRHIKSIVRTRYYEACAGAHYFNTTEGTYTVGEKYDRVDWAFRTPISRERIGLHHYAVKSKQEYEEKMARGSANLKSKTWDFWDRIEQAPALDCGSLAKYEP
jgi:Glycosyl transferase family 2